MSLDDSVGIGVATLLAQELARLVVPVVVRFAVPRLALDVASALFGLPRGGILGTTGHFAHTPRACVWVPVSPLIRLARSLPH